MKEIKDGYHFAQREKLEPDQQARWEERYRQQNKEQLQVWHSEIARAQRILSQ